MQKTLLSFFAKTPGSKPAPAPAPAASVQLDADKPSKAEPVSPSPPNNASPSAPSAATPSTVTKKRPAPDVATTSPRGASAPVDRTPARNTGSATKPKPAAKSPKSTPRPAKRRVLADSDDDAASPPSGSESEAEFAPSSSESEDLQPTSDSEGEVQADDSDDSGAGKKTKRKAPAKPKKAPASSPAASRKSKPTPSNPAASPSRAGVDDDNDGAVAAGATPDVYPHMTWPWLHTDRKDGAGRRPDHPDYDPRTLTVDKSFLDKQTPGHHAWWSFKSRNMDSVLLFKVGKFYETYHMDADVLVKELDLVYMKGQIAHAGFPEIAYGRFSDALVAKGYRVARVEQTETPEMLKERNAATTKGVKKDKVVRRELCCLKSPGTRTFSFLDRRQDTDFSSNSESQDDSGMPALLMAIFEQPLSAVSTSKSSRLVTSYGIAIADASTAKFCLAQFPDDRSRTRLRTLLAQAPPAELLTLRGNLDEFSQRILRYDAPSAARSELPPKEFPSPQTTLKLLQDPKYFHAESSAPTAVESLPPFLQAVVARMSDDADDVAVAPGGSAMTAFGAMITYLQRCLIDQSLLSLAQFYAYVPPAIADNTTAGDADDEVTVEPTQPSDTVVANVPIGFTENSSRMVLDGTTIVNLDIVSNSVDGGRKGSLLDTLDRCVTAQGKRMFTQWLCAPLRQVADIHARLEAVSDLMGRRDLMDTVRNLFKQLPDIDRLLSRVHTLGLKLSPDHPENRAVYYEASTYNKRKIRDFLTALRGLKVARRVQDMFVDAADPTQLVEGLSSLILRDLMIEKTPNISKTLAFFDGAFDARQAEAEGCIIPKRGVDDAYDNALDTISRLEAQLAQYLESQKAVLRCRDIEYFHNKVNAKDRYQIEVPESACKHVPDSYSLSSQKKGYRRYTTAESTSLLNQLCKAEDAKAAAIADTMRRMFARFDAHYNEFASVSAAMSYLDCLMSLALWSSSSDAMCKPEFLDSEEPYLELREVRHPTLVGLTSTEFIPNDIVLGTRGCSDAQPTCVLLTGPNMGGKSTLLRQACLAAIIAQMGGYVPAKSCVLTPVDRVFTRVGASDRILAGQSTFFVELTETSSILRLATRRSLVILDELGRGTSTFDGNAIAYAVVKHLTDVIGARTMFATHYHSLCEEFSTHPRVGLAHMGCIAEELPDGTSHVTFLYKLTPGACPKSYGLNVARLAHLPESIIQAANTRSSQFEQALLRSTAIHVTKQVAAAIESGDAAALLKAWKSAKSAVQFDADVSM